MRKHKKIIALFLLILLAAIITFAIIKHVKKKDVDYVKVSVKNGLSVNYLDGDELIAENKEKKYTFSITNDSDREIYYQIDIDQFKEYKDLKYNLTCEETKLDTENKILDNSNLLEYAVINPGKTHTYVLKLSKAIKKHQLGFLNVSEYMFSQEYFAQTIIANSTVSQTPKTVVGVETSQSNEGLIQDVDDNGITYYFRGDVDNNYVIFADLLWRIVRINGNNTIRLVLDDATEDLVKYYSNINNKFTFNDSNLKDYLNDWYNSKLSNYDKYIVTNKVCNDSGYTGTDEYIFASSQRLTVNHNPIFNCVGDSSNSKITVLTADEVEYAGGLIGASNTEYYLYNNEITNSSWTSTPAKGSATYFNPYTISFNGALEDDTAADSERNVRPVINIIKNISVTGKGTKGEPYELLF